MTAILEGGEWSAACPRRTLPPGKIPVPILQEAGWAPGPVWTGGNSRPHRDLIPDRPARGSVAIPTELPDPRPYPIYLELLNRVISESLFLSVLFRLITIVIYNDLFASDENKYLRPSTSLGFFNTIALLHFLIIAGSIALTGIVDSRQRRMS